MKRNRVFALSYRIVAAILVLIGLLLNFNVFSGKLNFNGLIYYTVQSNILVLCTFVILIVKQLIVMKKDGKTGSSSFYARPKGAATLAITVTFLIFWIILAPTTFSMENVSKNYLLSLDNNLVHTVAPLLLIFDYVLFDYGKNFKKYDPLYWTIIPLVYLIFAVIRASIGEIGNTGSRYPYFFIDFDKFGGLTIVFIFGILLFFIGLGYLIRNFDLKREIDSLS